MSNSDVVPSRLRAEGSPDAPTYHKRHQAEDNSATKFYSIHVDEGWRTWILCTDMYEWAADELLARLRESNRAWPHAA